MTNPYIDKNQVDRSEQVAKAFLPTLEDIKKDPMFYADLVNDLLYHWIYGTRETAFMDMVKESVLIQNGDIKKK